LERRLTSLALSPNIVQEVRSREVELAALQPPEGLDANTAVAIHRTISDSFAAGFRVVLLCCAGLSIASAIVAWRMIPAAKLRRRSP